MGRSCRVLHLRQHHCRSTRKQISDNKDRIYYPVSPSGRGTPSSAFATYNMTPAYSRTLAFQVSKIFWENCWLLSHPNGRLWRLLGNGALSPLLLKFCILKTLTAREKIYDRPRMELRYPYIFQILLFGTLLLSKGSRFCLNNPENHSLHVPPLLLFWYLITLKWTPSQGVLNQKKRQERSHLLR